MLRHYESVPFSPPSFLPLCWALHGLCWALRGQFRRRRPKVTNKQQIQEKAQQQQIHRRARIPKRSSLTAGRTCKHRQQMKRPSQARLLQVQLQGQYPQPRRNVKEQKPRAVLEVRVCPRMKSSSERSNISRSFHPSHSRSHSSALALSMSTSPSPKIPTSFCPCTRSFKTKSDFLSVFKVL